jgi:hypothetical protein
MTFKNRDELMAAAKYFSSLPQGGYTQQLYNCKSTIICPDFSDLAILKSYSTIVAAFQYSTGILWVFGFYSHTTCQHVAKFKNLIRYKYSFKSWDFPQCVKLYNDSRTGKKAAKKNHDDDFASVIQQALEK